MQISLANCLCMPLDLLIDTILIKLIQYFLIRLIHFKTQYFHMWGCSSVVERTLSMCEARGSIPPHLHDCFVGFRFESLSSYTILNENHTLKMICLMAQWIARMTTVQKVAGSNPVVLNIKTGHFEKFELE